MFHRSPRVPPGLNTQGEGEMGTRLDNPHVPEGGFGLWNGVIKLNTPLALMSICILDPQVGSF